MPADDILKGKTVLLVDDEPDVLDTLEDLLSACTTLRASSFQQAKHLLEHEDIDVAVLDIMGVDGFELLRIAAAKNVVTVMLTAHALNPDAVKKSITGGADYYLPKEEMAAIADHLAEVLDARRQGRNPWERWLQRLGGFCEKHFGPDWQKNDKIFWDKFPFY